MFDIGLIIMVLMSIVAVVTDSIPFFHRHFGSHLVGLEWFFTIAFTLEYVLRLLCVRQPMRYVLSFNGLVDLCAILPSYLMLAFPHAAYLMSIRILRLLRIFRIFKLVRYVEAYQSLGRALLQSRFKIMVFMSVAMMMVLIIGTLMHIVEGAESGFTSIPAAMYWAITTMTTVGYGDIAPKTEIGRLIASFTMLIGWSIIAVPTAIVTAEISSMKPARPADITTRTCQLCLTEGHLRQAKFCFKCGAQLPPHIKTNAQLDKVSAEAGAEEGAQDAPIQRF
jgi:voltage-gated potassium channel